jgi:tetratricopeptide (TPR) repeat protein
LRAIELNPSCVAAQIGYGFLMTSLGRHEASIKAMQTAHRLDPHSLMNLALLAGAYCMAGRLPEALTHARQVIEMEPRFPTGHSCLGWILLSMNQREEALAAFRQGVACCPQSSLMVAHLAYGLAVGEREQEARGLLDQLLRGRAQAWVSPYWIALIYSALGEEDTALSWLDTAIEEWDGWRVFALSDLRTLRFRHQPRFDEWIARLGFTATQELDEA